MRASLVVAVGASLLWSNLAVADLVVAGRRSVLFYHENSGALLGQSGADTEGFCGMTRGPDGLLYVAGNILGYGTIYRFTGTGRSLGAFAGAHLRTPGNLAFGPDGNLYAIGSNWPDEPYRGLVIRYHGRTGAFMDYFITTNSSSGSFADLVFAEDGNLYVADNGSGILRFDAQTGAFRGVFAAGSELGQLRSMAFGPDGDLYVANRGSNAVARFHGTTGAFLGVLVAHGSGGLTEPKGMAFGPDGHLYVGNDSTQSILEFDGETGDFLGTFAPPGAYLRYPSRIVFTQRLTVQRNNNTATIRWPAMHGHAGLLSRSTLSPSWTPVSEMPILVENDYVVTRTCDGAGDFFRLCVP